MIRTWHTWMIFAACAAVVLAAMGWISHTVVRLDNAEVQAARQAALEENVRLGLWRMDSALAPLIAQESARPYSVYRAFYPMPRAYTREFQEIEYGNALVPSPLLDQASPYIRLHFEFTPQGRITSPQVPTGNMRDLAEASYTTHERIEAAAARLAELQSLINRDVIVAALGPPDIATGAVAIRVNRVAQTQPDQVASRQLPQPALTQQLDLQQRVRRQTDQIEMQQSENPRVSPTNQILMNTREWEARNDNIATNADTFANYGSNLFLPPPTVTEGLTHPVWIGEVLLLVRWASVNGQSYLQGCWLDWSAIRQWLRREVRDLLPEGDLEPVRASSAASAEGRMLAGLPVRLVPGRLPAYAEPGVSPIRVSLVLAWGCILLAAGAVVVLLLGTVALSERRAAFVSAVTHEMRTPLTTFRMYTEMLAKGMVRDEDKRQRYLDTLHAEADRLSHLVNNVLAYARLERNRPDDRAQRVTLGGLIDRANGRLAERAERAGMTLTVERNDDTLAATVRADTGAVEQILFNLVDNACKYAATAEDRRIHLQVDGNGKVGILRVRDHGPGIAASQARRLFRPFSKSARQAADSAPGIGLGLALSRRLARQMKGDLRLCRDGQPGTCFVITLPACS